MSDNHIETVNHLKKKLDKGVSFEKTTQKMHILYKLQKISISIKLLEATQIGFKIRELSKAEKNSDVGKTAKLLTLTWKEYVRKHQNSRGGGGGHSDASEDEENSSRDPEPHSSPERSSRHHSSSSKSKSKSSSHHNGGGHHQSDLGSQARNGHTLRLSEESEEEEDALTPDSNAHTSSSRHKSKKSHKKSKKHKKSKEVEPDSEEESRDERRKERKKRHREEEQGFKEPSSRGPREPEAPASVKRIRIKKPVDPNATNSRPKVDDMDDFSRMMMGGFVSSNSSSKVSATAKYPNSGPASLSGPSPSKSAVASSSAHRSSSSSRTSQPPKRAVLKCSSTRQLDSVAPNSVTPASRAPGLDILSSLPDPRDRPL